MAYKSQLGEDKYIFDKFVRNSIEHLPEGKYIEIGAVDGLLFSNTKYFHDHLGWRGVLVEASPKLFQRLIKNRPNDTCFNYAVTEVDGEVEFVGHSAVGGVDSLMGQAHKERWHPEPDKYKVPSKPFKSFVTPEILPYVDFFSCDVEGAEFEVLNTFNWDIPVWLVLVEMHEKLHREKNKLCRELLCDFGFQLHGKVGSLNELWINPNYERAQKAQIASGS